MSLLRVDQLQNRVATKTVTVADLVDSLATVQALESTSGASMILTASGKSVEDTIALLEGVDSFEELRTITPPADNVRVKLRGYRSGSELGGGWFIGKLTAGTDNGITVASNGGAYHWVRENVKNIDVFMAGAYGDGVTSDWTAIQSTINYVNTLALVAGAVTGEVILPFGYTYCVDETLYLDIPIKFNCQGNLYWAAKSGYCIRVGRGVGWNVQYDIYIRNAWADSKLSFPTTWVSGGTGLMLLTSITFSTIKIDTATGFTEAVLYMWADGALGYKTVVQHNTFNLGQIVNSGRGIRMSSLDAASSSAQANRFYIQNIYQNYDNIVLEGTATNSNTFWINAMDNCRNVGIDLYGHLNHFYVGFAGAPGTALRENSTYGNTVEFGNSVPTDLVLNFGASAMNTIRCANPGPSYLPASQSVVSGTNYQNTYGLPLSIYGNVTFTTTGTVQVYYGKNASNLNVVQTITGLAGTTLPIHMVVPPGYYYKLFTTTGTVSLGTLSLNAAA